MDYSKHNKNKKYDEENKSDKKNEKYDRDNIITYFM